MFNQLNNWEKSDMVLGKKVAIFDWELGRNSAPNDWQKISCSNSLYVDPRMSFAGSMSTLIRTPLYTRYIFYGGIHI